MLSQSTPHILILPSFYPTAHEPFYGIFFQEQAQMLQQAGLTMGVIYPHIKALKDFSLALLGQHYFQITYQQEMAIPTLRLQGWNLSPGYLKGAIYLWRKTALKLFKKYCNLYGKPDLIHVQSTLWAGAGALEIFERYAVPYLITEHRDNFLHPSLFGHSCNPVWLKELIANIFQQAVKLTAVSAALKTGMHSYLADQSKEIAILPNFIDTAFFTPLVQQKKSANFTFIAIANLVPSKNIALLIEAFYLLYQTDATIQLKIVGKGPLDQSLKKLVQERSLTHCIYFTGQLNRLQIKEALALSHVFVLPSLYETFGVAFVEALSMGLPLIGTRCGGPEEIISNSTGLFAENEVLSLKETMQLMKANYATYSADLLHREAVERFGKQTLISKWLTIYQETACSQ